MSSSTSDMPNLLPTSTQSENLPFSHPEPSLDAITVTPNEVSFLNRSEHGATSVCYDPDHYDLEVFWHHKAGLIVSPNATYLPHTVPELNRDDFRQNLTPKVLTDASIYLAFRPRYLRNSGDLFARLNLSNTVLRDLIIPVPGLKFVLDITVIQRWSRLEDALLDVATTLLAANRSFPGLQYPKLPWEYGYRDAHKSRDLTLSCAQRARDAFAELSALVSFSISLHMNAATGTTSAFKLVQERSSVKPAPSWFDLLAESYVCNFEPNVRVGGFVNPYTSRWMAYIGKFASAEVPIWIYWGYSHGITPPKDAAAYAYSPREDQVQAAQSRAQVTAALTLPIIRYHPTPTTGTHVLGPGNRSNPFYPPAFSVPPASHSNDEGRMDTGEPMASPVWQLSNLPVRDSPLSTSPWPESPPPEPSLSSEEDAARKEKALAALEEHFRRQHDARETRLANETRLEKQRRESWEKHAETTKMYTKVSAVYEWRELPDGTYERVKLASTELDAWFNYTRNQMIYIGHANMWELCPQRPRFSIEFPEETEPCPDNDDTDDGLPALPLKPPSVPLPRAPDDEMYAEDIRELMQVHIVNTASVDVAPTVPEAETFDFASFMKYRFGYDIFSPTGWTTNFDPSPKAQAATFEKAMGALSYSYNNAPPGLDVKDAVMNLIRILSNTTWTFEHLTASFDHTKDRALSLESATLQIVSVLDNELTKYIICPKGYVDKVPWGILVADASTVLLIFRHRYTTPSAIARKLVELGVPFHTVVVADAHPVKPRAEPVRGLGTRPNNYKPTHEDYSEYLRRRRDLLMGPKGRAALMHGGVVARIARDVLEDHTVLDGPSDDAVTVGRHQQFYFYDDALTDNDTNIICGVYYVDIESKPTSRKQVGPTDEFLNGTKSHMSFFPKDTTWNSSGAYLRLEWTEQAEEWYQKRKARIETDCELVSASKWRSILRKSNTLLKAVEKGTEHYQGGYLEDYCRQTCFVAQRH